MTLSILRSATPALALPLTFALLTACGDSDEPTGSTATSASGTDTDDSGSSTTGSGTASSSTTGSGTGSSTGSSTTGSGTGSSTTGSSSTTDATATDTSSTTDATATDTSSTTDATATDTSSTTDATATDTSSTTDATATDTDATATATDTDTAGDTCGDGTPDAGEVCLEPFAGIGTFIASRSIPEVEIGRVGGSDANDVAYYWDRPGAGDNTIVWLIGDGAGGFADGDQVTRAGLSGMRLADMDNDGDDDLLYRNGTRNVYVERTDGGLPANPSNFLIAPDDHVLATFDVGRIGGLANADLAFGVNENGVATGGHFQTAISNNVGAPGTPSALSPALGALALDVALGDNSDGSDEDLFILASNRVFVRTNNAGAFSGSYSLFIPGAVSDAVAMVSGDFNGDRAADVAVSSGSRVTVILGTGTGTLTTGGSIPIGSDVRPVVADLDGDDFDDLVILDRTNDEVWVALSNGDGTFAEAVMVYASSGADLYDVDAGELNGDDVDDLVIAGEGLLGVLLSNP
jgi:hypothetical protein